MRTFATWITNHRRLVIWIWIGVVVAAGFAAGSAGSDFKEDFGLPKSDSQKAVKLLEDNFPAQSGDSGQFVFRADAGVADPAVKKRIERAFAKIERVEGVTSIDSPYGPKGARQVSPDGRIAFATINWDKLIGSGDVAPKVMPVVRIIEQTRTAGLEVEGGGNAFQAAEQSHGRSSEMVGVSVAMLVLFLMFGTFLAMGMPIVTALVAVGTTESLITLSTHVFTTAQFATFLAAMIGLGVGIDYALFMVTRFRQGLRRGLEVHESVITAMDTAGRAVMFAGITVMIALLGLFLVGIAFLNGPAIASSLAVLLTMLASLTLLPALLTIAGHRLNQPFFRTLGSAIRRNAGKFTGGRIAGGIVSLPLLLLQCLLLPLSYLFYGAVIWLPSRILRLVHLPVPSRSHDVLDDDEQAHPRWHAWASAVQRHPWIVATVATGVLIVLAIPAFSLHMGVADAGASAPELTTRKAYDLLARGFGPGFNGPLTVVVESEAGDQRMAKLRKQLAADPNVVGAAVSPPVPSPNGKIALITVYPKSSPQDRATGELVKRIRADYLAPINRAGAGAHIAGVTAVFDDFTELISKKLKYFIGVVVLLSALLLMAVFRSIAIPVKAIVMNLIGILAAFGVTVAIFQWGWGASLIGVDKTAPIMPFLPVMMFAIVFGLSMDYEVFLMSRVHEEWERRRDADAAVLEGLASTGGVITAAAIIMVALFASFAVLSNDLTMKLFGVSLATTIFLDAFIIRSALVPAVMAILGEKAWYMPRWLDRIMPKLNVEPPETLHTDPQTGHTEHVTPTVAPD
jgi:RND superfamily putative drug exporter